MRPVLVTGAAGFIGSHLVDQLLESGAAVRVLDNLSTGALVNLQAAAERHRRHAGTPNGSQLEVIIGDIRDRKMVRKALRGVKSVFHLAALPAEVVSIMDPGEVHAANVEGTLNVLHGALTEGVWRVVFGSSAAVYGISDGVPVPEDGPVRPPTLFGASKLAAETYCQAFHARHRLDTVTLRYFNVYGPRQRAGSGGGLVANIVEALGQGRLLADCDERSAEDFLYVDDAVVATLAAGRAPRAAGRIINVGSGTLVSIGDLLVMLGNLLQTSTKARMRLSPESGPHQMCARMSLAAELLDFEPRVSLVDGLARLVRFMTESQHVEPHVLAQVGPE